MTRISKVLASVFSHFPTWRPGRPKEPTLASLRAAKISAKRREYAGKGGITVTRQQIRHELRKQYALVLRKAYERTTRQERRNLARAYAAGEWRDIRCLPKAA